MTAIFFGVFAAITLFSALAIATQKNLIYSAFLLLATFVGIACLYILLSADFIAVTHLLIYVGGILTLFLFGVLITKRKEARYLISGIQYRRRGAVVALAMGTSLLYVVSKDAGWLKTGVIASTNPAYTVGLGLIGPYVLPFELAGILLLVVLIGILSLASSIKS